MALVPTDNVNVDKPEDDKDHSTIDEEDNDSTLDTSGTKWYWRSWRML